MADQTIKCPFCPNLFFTEHDYKRHIEAYSYYKEAHEKNWQKEMEKRIKYE